MFTSPEFLDEVRSGLDRCHTIPQIEHVIRTMASSASIKHVAYYLGSVPGRPDAESILLRTYPNEWVKRYFQERYAEVDPAVSIGARSVLPQDWSSFGRPSPKVRMLFEEAREIGVGSQGVTIPIRGPLGETAVCSFTSDEGIDEWEELIHNCLPALHIGSYLVHQKVMELMGSPEAYCEPKLSPRELDCLRYCAVGMRDHEIAKVLKISKPVVSSYIESARYKLRASTRTNAVARAIKFRIISVDHL